MARGGAVRGRVWPIAGGRAGVAEAPRHRYLRTLLAGALLAWGGAAGAPAEAVQISLAAGAFDVDEDWGDGPYEAGIAVRLDALELWRSPSGVVLMPAFGGMTTEADAVYGWAGFAIEIPIGERWRLTPILAAGIYEQGHGKNLGGALEFRSGVEVAIRPTDRTAIGLEFYHLSNAGLHELNPGSNSLVLTFGFAP